MKFEILPWATEYPLLGIAGKKGAGKDTIAKMLPGFQPYAFAGRLKAAAKAICDFSESQVNGSLAEKETVDPYWGFTPRFFMQRLGTEIGRAIDPDIWIRGLDLALRGLTRHDFRPDRFNNKPGFKGIVITDCRFPNELQAVVDWGGFAVEVVRPSTESTDTHASENSLEGFAFDFTIHNTGDLAELASKVAKLLAEVS